MGPAPVGEEDRAAGMGVIKLSPAPITCRRPPNPMEGVTARGLVWQLRPACAIFAGKGKWIFTQLSKVEQSYIIVANNKANIMTAPNTTITVIYILISDLSKY